MTWQEFIRTESKQDYFLKLQAFLEDERQKFVIHPKENEVFQAFELTPIDQVKVVILGQDPYPTPGHAHGLAFSVAPDVRPIPKSLQNIFKEIHQNFGGETPENGNLTRWTKQGVLLINTVLTVRSGEANSHAGRVWERFTDAVIEQLNAQDQVMVFMLWGKNAQSKSRFLNHPKHLILQAPHPSPLSVYRGFFGCEHFRLANQWLEKYGLTQIDW